ncbi:MAG TPA: S9 family peptidase, partial [Usitatibacteraceae bacterium]|nr:S9 family peptidase [Usitatibacteraceae bacterium]
MHRYISRALAATLLLGFGAGAFAQKSAKDIPVETFLKRGQYGSMILSPDGSRLAALSPLKGRNNLVVLDLAKRTRNVITSFEAVDVANFSWINNDRVCFSVADGQEVSGRFTFRGSYCINQDGSGVRDFSEFARRGMTLYARTQDGSAKAYVGMNSRTRDSQDVYLLDTASGRSELLTFDSPGRVISWVLDWNNVPRVAVSSPERESNDALAWTQVWYREGKDAKWEKLWEFSQLAEGARSDDYAPLAFDFDNTTLYVSHNAGRDKRAIYKYDTKARKMGELVFEHPLIDVSGGLVFSRAQKKLLGIRYSAEKPSVKWFDPAMERLQSQLDSTLKGTFNSFALAPDNENLALIFAYSDTDPGMYHLLDRAKPSIESLVRTREWLDPALMSERRFIRYKARDGLEIPAWVTIPRGSSGKNLPLIVHVHGGPWVRVYGGGFGLEAQFFASRGYAVLEPEPRASTGFGKKLLRSGYKQWGQAMQDDINDGALYLVKEGIADARRMCIFGGSYGGYAASIGPARDPDFWKCAAPYVAVTDLGLMQTIAYSDISWASDFLQTDFKKMVGDSDADREMFAKTSAVQLAGRVKAPIFLSMGSDDVRVPITHGEKFRDALERNGKKIEYVVYPGEGHGYNKDEHRFDFYRRLEKFFAENLK